MKTHENNMEQDYQTHNTKQDFVWKHLCTTLDTPKKQSFFAQ